MNVVIIEDSDLIRVHLTRLIAMQPRIKIVGVATSEEQAVFVATSTRPDAILLDLTLSPGSGLRVLERIRKAGVSARVLVLTNDTNPKLLEACSAWGISGFYDKSMQAHECLVRLYSWLPALPSNEVERLQALEEVHLLDAPEQEIFDDLRRLAQDFVGVPMALISLLDKDRQWFLSHDGLNVRETSRSIAFCAHAILEHELMEVSDALGDARFKDNPLVTGSPNLRFYAGVPLVLSTGEALGTLCVLDTQPRQLTALQRKALTTIARSILSEMELRRRVTALALEVTKRQQAENQVHHMATRDGLTGLPNRITLLDRLSQELKVAERHSSKFGVVFLDMDRFKFINDTLGHRAGDEALITAAQRLQAAIRDSDTVARLGGDEFALILPGITSTAHATRIAEKLCASMHQPIEISGHQLQIDASIGVAVYPDHGATAEQLLGHADLAMYEAKNSGGACVRLYSPYLGELAETVRNLATELRDALERDELVVHYQPQISLKNGGLCGVEALVRWRHPARGLIPPDQFIAVAEDGGLIHTLGLMVLDKAMAQLAAWDEMALRVPRVAVNVSAKELRLGLDEEIADLLAQHGLGPRRLELEITESALILDGREALSVLEALRHKGVTVSVDDFGVGYSSLGQLHRLPIDCLKIDKCFIDHVTEDDTDASIVKAIVTLAQAMHLHTIAEGVESATQRDKVQALGCECVQGYFHAKPLTADELATWLRSRSEGTCDVCDDEAPDMDSPAVRERPVARGA